MSEAVNLNDYLGSPAPDPQDDIEGEFSPDANRDLALQIGLGTALGLAPEKVPGYIEGFTDAVTPYYEELGIAEALEQYGILGGGAGAGALPAWFRLIAGAGVTGLTIWQLRRGERAAFANHGAGSTNGGGDNGQAENASDDTGAADYTANYATS